MRRNACLAVLVLLVALTGARAGDEEARLAEGWAAYHSGAIDQAYDEFSRLFRENPQSEPVNFALGMAAFARGRFSHALFSFERVLILNPGNERARLELARTYVALEQYGFARQEFQRVLESSPPEQVQRNVERYLAFIDRSQSKWSINAQAALSGFHDDNVNFGPSSLFIETVVGTLQVNSNSEPQEAWGLSFGGAATVTVDIGRRRGWLLNGGVTGYGNWMDQAPEQEVGYFRGELGLRHITPRSLLDLPVKVDHLRVGHDELLTIAGAEPSVLFVPRTGWHLVTKGFLEARNYAGGEDRDAAYFRADQTVKKLFAGGRHNVALTVGAYHEDADVESHSNRGLDLTISGELTLFSKTVLYAMGEYRTAEYRGILLTGLQDEDRRDNQWQGMVGVRQGITEAMGLNASYRHVNNNSNFGLYDYDRNIVSVSTYLLF